MIGVHADLRGEIEGYGEACLAFAEKIAIALVGFDGGAEAGVLAHGPEAAAVHGGVDAAGEREFAGVAEVALGSQPVRSSGVITASIGRPVGDVALRSEMVADFLAWSQSSAKGHQRKDAREKASTTGEISGRGAPGETTRTKTRPSLWHTPPQCP